MENLNDNDQSSSQSPFANFYDEVFLLASADKQASFLRQLFTRDGSLCAGFMAYIDPPLKDIAIDAKAVDMAIVEMQKSIHRYPWDSFYEIDPTADDYITELWAALEKDITGPYEAQIGTFCKIGDLLSSLNCLRIIEMGTNLDWDEVEEPGGYYPDEVKIHIDIQFDFFIQCFLDNIFSKTLIKSAIAQVKVYQLTPGAYLRYTEDWQGVLAVLNDRLEGKV